ncbi:protease HtpX, partial [Stenotrophomonas maltophilia]
ERNPASASMFIINPLGALRMDRLFSPHPSTQERIDLLARMQVAPAAPSFARSAGPPVRRG